MPFFEGQDSRSSLEALWPCWSTGSMDWQVGCFAAKPYHVDVAPGAGGTRKAILPNALSMPDSAN